MAKRQVDWDRLRLELEAEREKLGLNMTAFSKELEISQSLYSMFIRGVRSGLGIDTLRCVCDYFGVDAFHWDLPQEEPEPEMVTKLKLALKDPEIKRKKGDLLKAVESLIDIIYKALPDRVKAGPNKP